MRRTRGRASTGTISSSLLRCWACRHIPGRPGPVARPDRRQHLRRERVPFRKSPRELTERYFTVTGTGLLG